MNATGCSGALRGAVDDERVNLSESERLYSVVGGGIILLSMIRYGSLTALLGTLLGAGLIYRGVTGHCDLSEALGQRKDSPGMEFNRNRQNQEQRHPVDVASSESFPASDPPAWTESTVR